MSEGQLYEMNPDDTADVYHVKYNWSEDSKMGIAPSKQVPFEKILIMRGQKFEL